MILPIWCQTVVFRVLRGMTSLDITRATMLKGEKFAAKAGGM